MQVPFPLLKRIVLKFQKGPERVDLYEPRLVPVVQMALHQVGMNGDTFSIKAPKECSKKFADT